uniref:Putative ovule protein n=1 Tax=Solanum chacoense TaxID=4108 RepID=A0A0V0HU08_SOLCH
MNCLFQKFSITFVNILGFFSSDLPVLNRGQQLKTSTKLICWTSTLLHMRTQTSFPYHINPSNKFLHKQILQDHYFQSNNPSLNYNKGCHPTLL